MKRCISVIVFICGLIFVFWQGHTGLFAQDAEKDPTAAKSIEELSLLIEKALTEKNVQKLEEIKKSNLELVRENLYLTTQKCSTLLDEGIKSELSGEREKGELNFKIARVMAEIYQRAYNNSYLMDKVDLSSRWGKVEKEKYLEAKKFYEQGEDARKKYSYETAMLAYNRSLSLYREIVCKLGEAKTLQSMGDVFFNLSEYENARRMYEEALAIFRQLNERQGEAICIYHIGDVLLWLSEYEQARKEFEKGLTIFREIKDRLGEANTIRGLGNVYCYLSENERAKQRYEEGLAIFREINNRLGIANCLYDLGLLYLFLNENEKARKNAEEALVIYHDLKIRGGEANCLGILGGVYWILSENEKAKQMYEEGLAIYSEIKDISGKAFCLLRLGEVHRILNENEKAYKKYEEALMIYREIKDRQGEANCIQCLGEMHRMLDESEKARQRYEECLMIYREINDQLGEANSLQRLGDEYRFLSEYEKAKQMYEEGLVIFRNINNPLGEANTLRSLGDLHYQLNEYEQARVSYDQGLAIYRGIKFKDGEAETLRSLGDIHLHLSEYKKARERYEQGLFIYREIKERKGEANCLWSLGEMHRMLGEYEKACEKYDQGLVIYREINAKLGEAVTLHCLGDLHRIASNYKQALLYYEKALSLQNRISERTGMGWSYYRLGQTFETMKNFSAAEKEYIHSIDTIEDVWSEMKREEFKIPYLTFNIFPYENLIDLLFRQGKGASAFQYAERSKARSFLYLLGNKRIDIKKGTPPELVQQEEEMRRNITALSRQIMDNENKEPAQRHSSTQLDKKLQELRQAHNETLVKIKLLCPEYANMIAVNPLSLEEIQGLIRAAGDTVFLEYYTTPGSAYLWVLDGKNTFPYKIEIDNDTLDKKVREFYYMISNPSFGVATLEFQAQALYDLLLKPAEKHWAGKTRIGIIPHGVLHYLPFEALMNNEKFLLEQDIKFFYLPSASVYKFCRDKNPLKKEQLIALGNPDGSLVWAETEVKEIKSLFKLNPKIYVGNEATETRVKTEGPLADILHLSCHGVFDSAHPMYSALKLAGDEKEDGNLEVQDIFQLELKPAYLVTLSACETHKGSIKAGDEIVVMSRAFIYAGTPSIVASLWNVNPDSTEKLMVSFYRELKNKDKLEALHSARKDMIEKQGKRHPFYWAPFVLIGDFR